MWSAFDGHICGCYYTTGKLRSTKRHYLPQVELQSRTTLTPVCFTTKLRQTFNNSNPEALSQVRYAFPLYDGVSVTGYTISYAETILKGTIQHIDDAKQSYIDAVDRGETAGLLESLPAGVFGVSLGNVPANIDIFVEITYCGELKHDAAVDGLRYMLPTSIAPRYGEYPGELLKTNCVPKSGISITVDIDMANSAIRKVQSPSHPISVSMGELSIASNGHGTPFKASQASITLSLRTTELGGDFILQIIVDDISTPKAVLETHPTLQNQMAIMATFVPKFTLKSQHPEIVFIADQSGSMMGSKNAAVISALKIFLKSLPLGVRFNICAFGDSFKMLWPRSQAYNQANVDKAINFVSAFTASYGGTDIIRPIVATFKNRYKDLPLEIMLLTDGEVWDESEIFGFITKQIHDDKVDARVFALGIGTEVSHTLVEGVARAGNGFAQFVAESENADQKVIRMLKAALYGHTNSYSIEVNYKDEQGKTSADSELDADYEIVEKVSNYLKLDDSDAVKPPPYDDSSKRAKCFYDQAVDVDEPQKTSYRYAHLPFIEIPKLLQAPATIPPLFPFNRMTFYLLLGPQTSQKKVCHMRAYNSQSKHTTNLSQVYSVTLRASSTEGPLELEIPISSNCNTGTTIHQLAARRSIQDLEEGRGWLQLASPSTTFGTQLLKAKFQSRFDEVVEREVVRLSEKFQVASQYTSFVALDEKTGNAQPIEEAVLPLSAVGQSDSSLKKSFQPLLFNQLAAAPRSLRKSNASISQPSTCPQYQLTHSMAIPRQSIMSSLSRYDPTIEYSALEAPAPLRDRMMYVKHPQRAEGRNLKHCKRKTLRNDAD